MASVAVSHSQLQAACGAPAECRFWVKVGPVNIVPLSVKGDDSRAEYLSQSVAINLTQRAYVLPGFVGNLNAVVAQHFFDPLRVAA